MIDWARLTVVSKGSLREGVIPSPGACARGGVGWSAGGALVCSRVHRAERGPGGRTRLPLPPRLRALAQRPGEVKGSENG